MLIFLQTCYSLKRSIFIKACDENSGEFWIIQDRDKLTETNPNVSAIKWLKAKKFGSRSNKRSIIYKLRDVSLLNNVVRNYYFRRFGIYID